jgi:hypothetical protein
MEDSQMASKFTFDDIRPPPLMDSRIEVFKAALQKLRAEKAKAEACRQGPYTMARLSQAVAHLEGRIRELSYPTRKPPQSRR